MGRRGPSPDSPEIKLLKGSRPRDRSRTGPAPTATSGPPEIHPLVAGDPVALAEWHKVTGLLEARGMLAPIFGPIIALYCTSFSRWREAEDLVRRDGMTVTIRGELKTHPAVRISRSEVAFMQRCLKELGLTPGSRVAPKVEAPREPDALEQFLSNMPRPRGPHAS
jgi:P27 family predicted phage terminase small subunit